MMANKADAEDCAKRLLCEIARQCSFKGQIHTIDQKTLFRCQLLFIFVYFLLMLQLVIMLMLVFGVDVDFVIGVNDDLGLG